MNAQQIRHDILAMMGRTGIKASRLARLSGVETSSLYNFLNGKASLHVDSLMKVWPYVYENPIPLEGLPGVSPIPLPPEPPHADSEERA